MMNVALSRRIGSLSLTQTLLGMSADDRHALVKAVTKAKNFTALAAKWKRLIWRAEKEKKNGKG